jgi:hypothetical protein
VSDLGIEAGSVARASRPEWVVRLRRPLLLLVVTILCAGAYLAGIWTGMNTHVTCNVSGPGAIVCGDGADSSPPPAPTPPPQNPTASA